jgi:hypothetical protein
MFYNFHNLGYYLADLPRDIFAEINKEVRSIQNDFENSDPANYMLAGHLEKEFVLKECNASVEKVVLHALKDYDSTFNYIQSFDCLDQNIPIGLSNLWVNFQKKGEFNPLHGHSGIMSFVIWSKVPYTIDDERKTSPGKDSIEDLSGCFQFTYSDILGNLHTHTIPVDNSYEGKILMFPNKLLHTVYPFYSSDDYRISISGNISLKAKQ